MSKTKDYPEIKKDIEALLRLDWGPRCEIKDIDEFPELLENPERNSRCPACLAYEKFDDFWSYFAHGEE